MRRIMRLDVMSEVINMVEVGMAVVDAAQKFPVCFVCCCLETCLLILHSECLPRRHPDHEEHHGHH